jgi:ABC-type branched-subunit amino acid transport system substrate-binding protein
MKVAVITHLSPTHPLIISDFIKGVTLSLHKDHLLTKHFISADANTKTVLEEVQKLFLNDVDCIIAYSHINNLLKIEDLAHQMQKEVILIDSNSTNHPRPDSTFNSCWLSMQHIETSIHLASTLNISKKRIAVLSDLSSSGYHIGTHFIETTLQNKSEICLQFVSTNEQHIKLSLDQIAAEIIQQKPSVIYINAQGEEASLFLSLAKRKDIQDQIPSLKWAVNSEFFQQNDLDSEIWQKNIFCASTWHPQNNPEHPFVKKFQQETNRYPNLFAIVGHEAAKITDQINQNLIQSFESPRGELTWDPDNRMFKSIINSFLFNEKDNLMQQKFNKENVPLSNSNHFKPIISGWKNTYMCH